jgi:hypothetical protein
VNVAVLGEDSAPRHPPKKNYPIICGVSRYSILLEQNVFYFKMFISRNGNMTWPARIPDLNVCDFLLWGYLKSKVYENKPRTLEELKEAFRQVIGTITNQMLSKVFGSFTARL